jgi:hypothetical protein
MRNGVKALLCRVVSGDSSRPLCDNGRCWELGQELNASDLKFYSPPASSSASRCG